MSTTGRSDRKVKRVFLLGAGASHGARTPRPPLGTTLHQYLIGYLKAAWDELKQLEEDDGTISSSVREELQKHLASTTSFEALAGALQDSDKFQLLQKLTFLTACALTPRVNDDPRGDDAFIENPDVYDRLLSYAFATYGSPKDNFFHHMELGLPSRTGDLSVYRSSRRKCRGSMPMRARELYATRLRREG